MAPVVLPLQIWRPSLLFFSKDCSFLVLLASLLFHRCVMPRAHDDCKFRDEWLVQDKYKERVVKDGDPRLARCQFCMKSSNFKFHHPWTMPIAPWPCMIASNANSRMNSLLSWSVGVFEKVRVDVGTRACVIHVL